MSLLTLFIVVQYIIMGLILINTFTNLPKMQIGDIDHLRDHIGDNTLFGYQIAELTIVSFTAFIVAVGTVINFFFSIYSAL